MPLDNVTETDGQMNAGYTADSETESNMDMNTVNIQVSKKKEIPDSPELVTSETVTSTEEFTDPPCKWGPCLTLACCDGCRNTKVVLLLLCCAAFVQGMVINGFINSIISNLEKRFDLKSADTGLIASCYDIASVLCLIPVSYLGGIGSKPRWLGFGIILMGLGSIVFAVPHFTTGLYSEQATFTDASLTDGCNTDTENGSMLLTDVLCSEAESSLSNYKYVLMLGQLLHGAGASPLYTLGIFYTMAIVGPAVGYILGGYFVSLYTDFDRMDISELTLTPDSVSWVGAWWLGFLIGGILAVIIGTIILGFPATLPGYAKLKATRVSESYNGVEGVSVIQSGFSSLSTFPQSLRVLLTNPTFILVCLGGASDGLITAGVATFLPKYLEFQFSQSASFASILVGLSVVPSGGGGMLLGGYLVKRLSLSVRGTLWLCVALSAGSMLTTLTVLIKCDDAKLAGVNHHYSNTSHTDELTELSLTSACNSMCQCPNIMFHPVCGSDQVMYFTACAAGCTDSSQEDNTKVYTNCSCIENSGSSDLVPGSATEGRCSLDCDLLTVFMVLLSVNIFLGYLTTMPALSATLRCVPHPQCSFALGLQWIFIRCLGTIPGPILFGAIIDASCVFWWRPCEDSQDGACHYYSSDHMRYYFLGVIMGLRWLAMLFYLFASVCYKAPSADQKPAVSGMQLSTDSVPHTDHK